MSEIRIMHQRLADTLRPLRTDRRGNVLMLMGFALVPITFATGMVVDYSRAARLQTKLNAVADAAGLSATTTPMFKKPWQTACKLARANFINGATGLKGLTLNTSVAAELTISITETYAVGPETTYTCPITAATPTGSEVAPLKRIATVVYAGQSANAFAGVLGSSNIAIGGRSEAKVSAAPYIDIYMGLDTSQSMGLASTTAGAVSLWNITKTQGDEACTFGCHVALAGKPKSNEQLAKDNNIELRVDVLRKATVDIVQTAITEQGDKQLYRFGLYRIGTATSTISNLTTDLNSVKNLSSQISLGPNDTGGTGDTNLLDLTTNIYDKIIARGNGETQEKARPFLFLITDGVIDVKGSCTYSHCTSPIDPTQCQRYKDAGITVGVVYTTFLPILKDPTNTSSTETDFRYNALVKTFSVKDANNKTQTAAQIAPNLRSCASNGWYFEGSDSATIHSAIQKLFRQASQTSSLTR